MAKALLAEYRIGGDVIDRVAAPPPAEPSIYLPLHSGARGASPESSPTVVGAAEASPETAAEKTEQDHGDSELRFERDGLFHVFTIGAITYRLGGVRQLFVTCLRVNIRAKYEALSYYDSLDLYAAKARTGFAQAFARATGAELARVEKDLVLILERLEAERDEALRAGSRKATIEVSAADRELGLSLLRDPRLFERIVSDMSALGYVGEDLNKELLYLCASSRKLDDPISVLILSQSASGKSYLVDTVRKLMPAEDVVAVTSLSDQALNYIDDLTHKFLILGEAVHGEVVEHQIREMLSGKELSRLVTIKDPETGKMQSRVVRTPVIVASVMSGTSHDLNPENASRYFVVNADESREQTERIHEEQRRKYSLERLEAGRGGLETLIRAHQAAQRLLQKRQVVNDFAPLLGFPVSLMRSRRDHDRFLDLIACVCYVRQYQKRSEHVGAVEFIRADLEDYKVAYRIMVEGVLASTIRELPAGAVGLYEEIRTWIRREATKQGLRPEELSFTQRQVREMTGLGHTWVKEALRKLVDYDHVTIARGGGARSRAFYRLREDEALTGVDLSMIPSPEEMRKKLELGDLGAPGH
jgi:DNA-binding GntR family transcriptional regulator